MRKNSKDLYLSNATSIDNGIIFYSTSHKHYAAIATIDDDGNITAEWTKIKGIGKIRAFVFALIPAIFFIMFLYFPNSHLITYPVFLFCLFTFVFCSFTLYALVNRLRKKNLFKFHAAEHMVINAYEALKRAPSLQEVQAFSKFINNCETNIITSYIVMLISAIACSFIPGLLHQLIVLSFCTALVLFLFERGALNFMQRFTTTPPTRKELEVAIAAMNVWLENEEKEE